jgi:ABC-type glycerol-3-phosphate transport system permease component
LFVGSIWGAVTAVSREIAPGDSVWWVVACWAFFATPVVLVIALLVRRSLVRGIAGGDGYDEFS